MADVDVTIPENQPLSEVHVLTTESELKYMGIGMRWNDAELFCVSSGGHLASVSSPYQWHKMKAFIREKQISDYEFIWLGGTDAKKEGEWTWTDGSKWSEQHWFSADPIQPWDLNHVNHHVPHIF